MEKLTIAELETLLDAEGRHARIAVDGTVSTLAERAAPYLDALQRYSDAWYTLALEHGMRAAVAASHAKHVQDAINGLRSVLSEHNGT